MTEATPHINHSPNCTDPTSRHRIGNRGDALLTCIDCGRFVILEHAESRVQSRGQEEDTAPVPSGTPEEFSSPPVTGSGGKLLPPARNHVPARFKLNCVRCDSTIRLHRPEPVTPVCVNCRPGSRQAA